MSQEQEPVNPDLEQYVAWEMADHLSPEQVEALLLDKEFGEKVTEAIKRTDIQSEEVPIADIKLGQEFGFMGFREQWSTNERIYLSPLFSGDEDRINLIGQSDDFLEANPDIPPLSFFDMHTHPRMTSSVAYDALASALFSARKRSPSVAMAQSLFSIADLRNFKRASREESPAYIKALGYKRAAEVHGRLTLVSFGSLESFRDFDPRRVVTQSYGYYKSHRRDPLDVYRESGLNVAMLTVDLGSGGLFDKVEVQEASRAITKVVS